MTRTYPTSRVTAEILLAQYIKQIAVRLSGVTL